MINPTTRSVIAAATLLCTGQAALCQEIDFESKYLSNRVAGFHGYRLAGKLAGPARLTLDPNACGLNGFGDRTFCTLIALTVKDVTLTELRVHDPTGQRRRVFAISQHGLPGDLRLITTTSADDGWFVYTERTGVRTVIDLDPTRSGTSPGAHSGSGATAASCLPLPRTVDGTKAQYKVVPGFVTNTWILLLKGKKLNLGTRIEFQPVHYVQRPDYWQINVVECSDGIVIPAISPYDEAFEITPFLGTKGIELVFGDDKVRIDVPPSTKK